MTVEVRRKAIMTRRNALAALLLALLLAIPSCKKNVETTKPSTPELSTEIYGRLKGGKGSGVVGGPLGGVSVTATLGDKTVGPVLSDSSGTFTIDAFELMPAGTQKTQEGLAAVQPVAVDVKFEKTGFKTQTEVVTVPVPKYEEFVFYLTGEGD